jgi:preprotein translocase subunit SecA
LKVEGLYTDQPRTSLLLMRGLCFAIVDEADSVLVDEARTPLIISKAGDTAQQERIYRDAINVARKMISPRDFTIRERERQIEITDLGKAQAIRLTRSLGGVWTGAKRREDLLKQALSALHIFQLDRDYLVMDDQVQIVDEYTGRVMADRSWERGLHQMVEAKEGLAISGRQETLARISYQRFFRRYLRLSGMTGTCREVAAELWSVYRLNVVTVPTNRRSRRAAVPHRVYMSADMKWRAIVECVRHQHGQDRPILIGTRSVAASEHLSELLNAVGLPHRVLNARQDEEEAEIIAEAGRMGRITVATNMAGRGTDIVLADRVAELGGLFVLATERHEARRIDRQLFGRGGRQGDPGSYQAIVSFEDDLVGKFYGKSLDWLLNRWRKGQKPLPSGLGGAIVGAAQMAAEYHHSRARRDLLRVDDNTGDMLAFSGRGE